ncbi:hypothetical protein [Streptomyces sp. NPDC048385]
MALHHDLRVAFAVLQEAVAGYYATAHNAPSHPTSAPPPAGPHCGRTR